MNIYSNEFTAWFHKDMLKSPIKMEFRICNGIEVQHSHN